jgi:predicted N-formylglutamate amidohydrolase
VSARRRWSIVVTCEHGGHDVPSEHRALFRGHADILRSHRGWDPGTLHLARELAERLDAPLVASTTTRLLIDLNRSPHNARAFSTVTRGLPRAERAALLERFHRPHWEAARAAVARGLLGGRRVLHLGVHSFTPVLDGVVRTPDLALLYDPAREPECALAVAWTRSLARALPGYAVRRNDPYRGSTDGLTTALRRSHVAARYVGIEIEVNQRHVGRGGRFPQWVADALADTFEEVLA